MRQFRNIEVAGYPVDGNTFDEINTQIQQVAQFSAAINGDNYIASGVAKIAPTTYTSGWIVWNGEILPFQGGEFDTEVTIVEDVITRTYQDEIQKGHVTNRYAKFGNDGVETFDFSDLKPVYTRFANEFLNSVLLPYTGLLAELPKGFALADGLEGRPNAGGRVVVGYKVGDPDYGAIGAVGGNEYVELLATNIPKHSHTGTTDNDGAHSHTGFTFVGSGDDNGDAGNLIVTSPDENNGDRTQSTAVISSNNSAHEHDFETDETYGNPDGSTAPIDVRQPYIVGAYMTWVGF